MSQWTQVSGVIHIDTFARSTAEAMYLARTIIGNLPRVTGSERDVQFHLNVPEGATYWSGTDEFGRDSNLYNDPSGEPWFATQPNIVATIHGNLRDRTFRETLREVTIMLNRLSARLYVDRCIISVKGQGRTFIFDSPVWLSQNMTLDYRERLLPSAPQGRDMQCGTGKHKRKNEEEPA